ncbi:hypothetical protein ACJX0J_025402, partial [Zea mays]
MIQREGKEKVEEKEDIVGGEGFLPKIQNNKINKPHRRERSVGYICTKNDNSLLLYNLENRTEDYASMTCTMNMLINNFPFAFVLFCKKNEKRMCPNGFTQYDQNVYVGLSLWALYLRFDFALDIILVLDVFESILSLGAHILFSETRYLADDADCQFDCGNVCLQFCMFICLILFFIRGIFMGFEYVARNVLWWYTGGKIL